MDNTERFFWDLSHSTIITEKKLRADYEELRAIDYDFRHNYDSFEQYVYACCGKNGDLEQLHKGPAQFDADNGDDVGAVHQFLALLEAIRDGDKTGRNITITVDGYTLQAYDDAAQLQGLINAVDAFEDSIG